MSQTSKKWKQLTIDSFLSKNSSQLTSRTMKHRRVEAEPHSNGWFDLSLEIREMVIDKMDPKTRCKFAQCSQLCEQEAKKSNKYLYRIGIIRSHDEPTLHFSHRVSSDSDFWLEFLYARNSQTIVVYRCYSNGQEVAKWTKVVHESIDEVREKYFKDYVEKYKHCIRSVTFNDDGDDTEMANLSIKNLKNLRKLDILNKDYHSTNIVECGFIGDNQLMRFDYLNMPNYNLTFAQVVNFRGRMLSVTCKAFTKENINRYLKAMRLGKIHKFLNSVKINTENASRSDINVIMEDLGAFGYVEFVVEGLYAFKFRSIIRKNGHFFVTFKPRQDTIEIVWKNIKPAIQK